MVEYVRDQGHDCTMMSENSMTGVDKEMIMLKAAALALSWQVTVICRFQRSFPQFPFRSHINAEERSFSSQKASISKAATSGTGMYSFRLDTYSLPYTRGRGT